MKIAILTQPLCNNYGGILQNYALQTVLRRMGHQPVTLNTSTPKASYTPHRLVLSCCKRWLKKYIYSDPSILFVNPLKQSRKAVELATEHKRFMEQHIAVEQVELPLMPDFCKAHDYEAYVVGSDQVWRPRYNRQLANFYLDFTQGANVRRIAYAASFGVDEWEATEPMTERLKTLAQSFDAISVREQSGVALCDKYLHSLATWVLDPTMLLTAGDYKDLAEKHNGKKVAQQEYIAAYILDINKQKETQLAQLSQQTRLPIRYIGRMTTTDYPSIESWLNGIANAKYVVTDSFHGTLFSIIFRKQFLAIGNLARGNARFESLLSMFGLEGRMTDIISADQLVADIDYVAVDAILSAEQNRAIEFLNKALG